MTSEFFRARYVTYKADKSRKFKFSIYPFPPLLPINNFSTTLVLLLASLCSAVVDFVSTYKLVL